MEYNTADIKIIAEKLRKLRDSGNAAVILIGAGVSKSAGIPLAGEMVEDLKKQYPQLCEQCKNDTFPSHMALLAPMERRDFIGKYIDQAKINLAHLYLGALVKEKYVDRILTVNFDPLILRSLSLYNIFPAIYDFAASQHFIPGEAAELSAFYLHGQRDGFVQLSTEDEVRAHSEKLKPVFTEVSSKRCWIVVGYSGENDPVFERLSEIDVFQNKLFWIGFKDNEPAEHVGKKILNPINRYSYFVKGYDADSFFLQLARELKLSEPDIISKPFTHLKEEINTLAQFTINDKATDPTKETKEWIDLAIEGFEKGKGFENLVGTRKEQISKDELVKKLRDIWINGNYEELTEDLVQKVTESGTNTALEILSTLYSNWGVNIQEKVKNNPKPQDLLIQAIEKYKAAIKIKKDYADPYNNWGVALTELAKLKNDEKLFEEAIEKHKEAINIKKDYADPYNNWGIALSELAKLKNDEKLFEEALEKFREAIKIKKDNGYAYNNWGLALLDLAKLKNDEKFLEEALEKFKEAINIIKDKSDILNSWGTALVELAKLKNNEKLFGEAFEKFKEAINNKKDYFSAFNNWGAALADFAEFKNDEKIYEEAFEKFREAIKIKKDYAYAFNNWGSALSDLAKLKNDEKFFKEAIEKYKKAIDIKKDYAGAFNSWGCTLIDLARLKNDEKFFKEGFEKFREAVNIKNDYYEAITNWGIGVFDLGRVTIEPQKTNLFNKAIEKFLTAEKIKNGDATYCLACAYSYMGKTKEATEWFEKTMKTKSYPYRDKIINDKDLDNIKNLPEFQKLLNQYLPKI
jgi:tetratricopeptide (TPR) repeat protein